MTARSKPAIGVRGARDVRAIEEHRDPAAAVATNGESGAGGAAGAADGRCAEASLHDQYAELLASGLACDRW
jgi:hypothetical protein